MYRVITYNGTKNLGDIIQTIALTQHFGNLQTIAVPRHTLKNLQLGPLLIVNGYHCRRQEVPIKQIPAIFAGVHFSLHPQFSWAQQTNTIIGARDPYTYRKFCRINKRMLREERKRLRSEKRNPPQTIQSQFIGCATITFNKYSGPRSQILSVDLDGPGTQLSHAIRKGLSLIQQWELAIERLKLYRTAQEVHTSRLHVALPCLAFGTPVRIVPSESPEAQRRFSILNAWGIPYNKLVQLDMSQQRKVFLEFLKDHVPNLCIRPQNDDQFWPNPPIENLI
jgi:hypothetical protein